MPALPSPMPDTVEEMYTPDIDKETQRRLDFEATHRVIPPTVPMVMKPSWLNDTGKSVFISVEPSSIFLDSTPRSRFPLLEAASEMAREGIAKVTDAVDAADHLRVLLDQHLDTTRASRVQIEDGLVELADKMGLDHARLRRLLTPPAPLA